MEDQRQADELLIDLKKQSMRMINIEEVHQLLHQTQQIKIDQQIKEYMSLILVHLHHLYLINT